MTEDRSPDKGVGRKRWLRLKSTLAFLYFALMFFVIAPAGILYLSRDEPFALGGVPTTILGVAAIVVANAWAIRLVRSFISEGKGTQVPIDPPRKFVNSTSYGWTRNPMYLSYIITILGEAVLFQSLYLLAYVVGLWLIAHLYVIYREEPLLLKRFGAEYERYRTKVPRWLSLFARQHTK